MLGGSRVGAAGDDSGRAAVYRERVPRRLLSSLSRDPVKLDCALAVVLTILGELQVAAGGAAGSDRLVPALLVPLLGAALAIRRRHPTLAGTGAGILIGLEMSLRGDPQILSNAVAYLCALYALAVWSPPRRFLLGTIAIVIADIVPNPSAGTNVEWALGTIVVMLIVRRVVRDRDERATLAERERDLVAHQAVLEERTRLARELHDVISHGVTVMVVQAQAGPRLLGNPPEARGAFAAIEATGREALGELRRLLGVLRTGDERLVVAPQPGLASLEALVEELRETGRRVALRVDGTPVQLPPGIDLCAYRIVQEALTNTLKHAGEAETQITVHYADAAIELEVVDNGAGRALAPGGSGHGLIGMRERVALYGGMLEAGPRNGAGYAVRAWLPLQRDVAG
jgi:signal transduction histidine kinase